MNEPNLTELERDVEAARLRFASDLSVLRSPTTLSGFGEALKQDAIETKDALLQTAIETKDELLQTARLTAQSTVLGWVDAVKARAAANPTAVLLIGAGVAWRLIRHPPIATALVGAGVYSLLRATPLGPEGQSDAQYIEQAKARLLEQTGELTGAVKDYAATTAVEAREQATDLARVASLRAQQWTMEARHQARELSTGLAERTRTLSTQASDWFAEAAASSVTTGEQVLSDPEVRDNLLLAAAGIFVTAALGVASRRR